jgi:proteasome lid subunit RPN8/RPN11
VNKKGQAPNRLVLGPVIMVKLYGIVLERRGDIEQCGVLAGEVSGGGEAVVSRMAQLQNVHRSPEVNYQFDAVEQAMAWEQAESAGCEVVAVWHTHPHGPMHPSETDVAYMQPWLLYPILTPGIGRRVNMSVFRLRSLVYQADDGMGLGKPIEHSRWESVPHEVRR